MRKKKDILNDLQVASNQKIAYECELNDYLKSHSTSSTAGIKGNIGEWSEIYVFFRLMEQGKLETADENMSPICDAFLPVLKIIREENDDPLIYYTSNPENHEKAISIFYEGVDQPVWTGKAEDFKANADLLLSHLQEKKNKKGVASSEAYSDIEKFTDEIMIHKIKSPSKAISASFGGKSDITMQIIQQDNMHVPAGFSIKSSIGSASTLINASNASVFVYKLNNCTDKIMDEANHTRDLTEKSGDRITCLIDCLLQNNVDIVYDSLKNKTAQMNLTLISTDTPVIVGTALLQSYICKSGQNPLKDLKEIALKIAEKNPCGIPDLAKDTYYAKRLKDFLFEFACGMQFSELWDGTTKIQGGYIFVTKKGDILAYYASNQDTFKDFLITNTKFDTPSTKRYPDCYSVYKNNGEYFLQLPLQIRYKQ